MEVNLYHQIHKDTVTKAFSILKVTSHYLVFNNLFIIIIIIIDI